MTLNTMNEIREALVSAKERIAELSGWCKIPTEGQTITEIEDAIHMLDICIVDEQSE